ncbi:MAG: hypothetical protein QM753_14930 [Thermomicrobiales bacterium]
MAVAVALVFVWLGMVIAISFIEAPLKFRAPGVTRELGLGIGRFVFKALTACELLLAVATGVALAMDGGSRATWWAFAPLVAILVAQLAMLHTVMDRRAARIVAGESVPPSPHHLIYIGLEGAKVMLLIAAGTILLRSLAG